MRHKVAGYKLGRNTSHRRSLLRNLVTSIILEERIETTLPKAKAMRPIVEKMITLGKRGDLSARRQALAYLMTSAAVDKLFDTVGPRFETAKAATRASSTPAGKKAMARIKPSSNFWEAKNYRKKNAKSAPSSAINAPKKPSARWKKPKPKAESSIPPTKPKAKTKSPKRKKNKSSYRPWL